METGKKTVVLGASSNPGRYSYLAVNKLTAYKHPVVAIGKRKGAVGAVEIQTDHTPVPDVHTVTLYLNPQNQRDYYDYILSLQPTRIIFNPGTENSELESKATEAGIETVEGCTLVMLSVGAY
ncbi:MAG TPA: CoA-binding protein [Chitinophagaceae bacterium]|nr:CoA-binding protein [Chitinophagaceae bacterium]